MPTRESALEASIVRRVFETWSIEIPAAFEETFVTEGEGYWHAFDRNRSVSLSSLVMMDGAERASAAEIVSRLPRWHGRGVSSVPPGVIGWAVTSPAPKSSRASRMLSGWLAVDGRVLLATITADDLEWARKTWMTIRHRTTPRVLSAGSWLAELSTKPRHES